MSNIVIASKTEKHTWSFLFVNEQVVTTLTLVKLDNGKVGINYDVSFSGIKSGHVTGGPIVVKGNEMVKLHSDPDVFVEVTQFQKSKTYVSMHIKIAVHAPSPIGEKVIFDQTLGGNIPAENGFTIPILQLNELAETQKTEAL